MSRTSFLASPRMGNDEPLPAGEPIVDVTSLGPGKTIASAIHSPPRAQILRPKMDKISYQKQVNNTVGMAQSMLKRAKMISMRHAQIAVSYDALHGILCEPPEKRERIAAEIVSWMDARCSRV